jgi:prolipoprotein diacylglyceryl transferase
MAEPKPSDRGRREAGATARSSSVFPHSTPRARPCSRHLCQPNRSVIPAFIPSPSSNGFHVGPLFVHAYGLMYVLGGAAAIGLTVRRWEKQGGRRELVYDVAMWGFPAGLVGARFYNLATSWSEVPHHWWGPFAIWKGGLGIWGGIAAGALVGVWRLRRAGADIPAFMDAAAPGLLAAQAIGRIGNYFNQELFGGPTTLPWGLEIDPAHRPAGYERYATFHPTFLYELVFDLTLAAALIALGRSRRVRAPGLFALYVAGYSGFRIFEELLRVDPSHHILGLRLNFYVASVLTLAGLAWFVRIQRRATPPTGRELDPPRRRAAGRRRRGRLAGCGHSTNASASSPANAQRTEITGIARQSRAPADLELARVERANHPAFTHPPPNRRAIHLAAMLAPRPVIVPGVVPFSTQRVGGGRRLRGRGRRTRRRNR